MEFLKTHKVALTPLSPIHIGCGEDFEPTNYVIDAEQKLLYGFDPSRAVLSETLAKQLSVFGEQGNLQGIQKFFRDNQDCFKPFSHVLMSVASGVANDYKNKIGTVVNLEANGNRVFNQFTIERHTHSRNTPYIPGSSLKGALRTALMDRLNNRRPVTDKDEKRNSSKLAKRLLDGDFDKSPLRLLKIGDLMPEAWLGREVLYAVNRYKRPKFDQQNGQQKAPRGVVARKECIQTGQYRALSGEITIQNLGGKGVKTGEKRNVPSLQPDIAQIAKDSNAYHLPRLKDELAQMDKTGLVNPDWKYVMESLLKEGGQLDKRLKAGQALLVRLGRYGGAESKTLTEVADIKIMGKQGQPPKYLPKTTTYWLAAQTAEDQKHLIPFGWALIEIDPQDELPELKTWCEAQSKNRPDMREKYASLASDRAKAEREAAQQKAEREARLAAERQVAEDLAKAEAEHQAHLVDLSEAGRKIEAYNDNCAKRVQSLGGRKGKPYGADYQQAKTLADSARAEADWDAAERQTAAEAIEHWLPLLESLDIKEIRKKLKLSELKGDTV
jgi:CRISPR-associated protein Csm5